MREALSARKALAGRSPGRARRNHRVDDLSEADLARPAQGMPARHDEDEPVGTERMRDEAAGVDRAGDDADIADPLRDKADDRRTGAPRGRSRPADGTRGRSRAPRAGTRSGRWCSRGSGSARRARRRRRRDPPSGARSERGGPEACWTRVRPAGVGTTPCRVRTRRGAPSDFSMLRMRVLTRAASARCARPRAMGDAAGVDDVQEEVEVGQIELHGRAFAAFAIREGRVDAIRIACRKRAAHGSPLTKCRLSVAVRRPSPLPVPSGGSSA